MNLPWINTTANPVQRASQNQTWARPISNSYPVGTFFVTAANGQPLAPGQPSGLTRIVKQGLQTTGDPRAYGSFWQISTPSEVAQSLTGAPANLTGGSNFNFSLSPSNNNWLWVALGGIVLYWFLK